VGRQLPMGVTLQHQLDLERFLPYRIHHLWARTSSPRIAILRSGDAVRAREWRVILVLAAFGPLTNREIADLASMDTGTTARAIKDLLEMGLVATRPHQADKRRQVVTLTEKGAAAHDEIAPQRLEFSEYLLSGLSSEERTHLFRIIDKLEARAKERALPTDDRYSEEHWSGGAE
jgi:DNA-binding MarR family transcriptional regulator